MGEQAFKYIYRFIYTDKVKFTIILTRRKREREIESEKERGNST